ncbi:type II toxin-antitoxin system VapC family toxin [Picosynechococcus sp. PCC 73109]|uniref:type II toxin-antitoxin system VapC family toxin n=1 Tax=Picosynechococcus sp. PCC 73109 TaxID=374982 RepID=UPI0007458AE1|nr:PIN domain-containing protein [Picosynechococcus sp. PCC 73109]AMA08819.1 pilus assembly protein [Picosynechococcus sp. PCC 73109]
MRRDVILDTSPLVALINKKDNTHEWTKQQWSQIKPPLLTCESVITESFFLLRNIYGGDTAVIRLLEKGVITIAFDLESEIESIKDLLTRYKSVPVSLADACLVRMAEQNPNSSVFTLDSDFRIYRKNRNQIIDLITPEDK